MAFTPMPLLGGQLSWRPQADDVVIVLSAAAAITLPSSGYRLVKVQSTSVTTPGAFEIIYDGVNTAYFPTVPGTQSWGVTWPTQGSQLPATLFSFVGGLSGVVLTFSKGQSQGPVIQNYKSLRFTVTHSAAHSTPTAFSQGTFPCGTAIPNGVMAFATVPIDVFYWPSVGGPQSGHAAEATVSSVSIGAAPPISKNQYITPSYTNVTAAGTLDAYVGYDPA